MPRYPQGILVSCEVPWDEQERLMEDVFRREVRMMLELGFKDIYIFGTAGEGHAVDTPRFRQIAEIFYEETRGEGVRPQVGVIGLSTANIVERIRIAHDIGFRVFQISLPAWGELNDTELLTFFKDVCGSFPDSQFLHYNLLRAKRLLTGKDYRRIADVVPNLVATKNTGGGAERAHDLMRHAPDLQHFFGEGNFPHGILRGECSILSSFAAMLPRPAKALFEAGQKRDYETMMKLQQWYADMMHDVLGPLLAQGRMDGAYDKLIVRLAGLEEMPLRLLSPYQGFSEEEYQQAKQIFDAHYRDWNG